MRLWVEGDEETIMILVAMAVSWDKKEYTGCLLGNDGCDYRLTNMKRTKYKMKRNLRFILNDDNTGCYGNENEVKKT